MILTKLFSWILGLFSAMRKTFNKLDESERKLSIKASAIIAVINSNLSERTEVIHQILTLKFPELTQATLSTYFQEVISNLSISDTRSIGTVEQCISVIQQYLVEHKGNIWVNRTQSVVGALITAMLPGSKIQKIMMVLEYIYQTFVKNKH